VYEVQSRVHLTDFIVKLNVPNQSATVVVLCGSVLSFRVYIVHSDTRSDRGNQIKTYVNNNSLAERPFICLTVTQACMRV
jgi:hypothetical protein